MSLCVLHILIVWGREALIFPPTHNHYMQQGMPETEATSDLEYWLLSRQLFSYFSQYLT